MAGTMKNNIVQRNLISVQMPKKYIADYLEENKIRYWKIPYTDSQEHTELRRTLKVLGDNSMNFMMVLEN